MICRTILWSNHAKTGEFREIQLNQQTIRFEPKIVRISALYGVTLQSRNPYNFWFIFWEKRWLHKFIHKFTYLYSLISMGQLHIFLDCNIKPVIMKWHVCKGQYISESIYEVIVSPKIWTENCKDFWPVVWHNKGQKSLQNLVHILGETIIS